jgi:hypothetical protein
VNYVNKEYPNPLMIQKPHLAHHLFVIFQALTFQTISCPKRASTMQTKTMGDADKNNGRYTILLRDSKVGKAKSKIQCRGII